MKDNNHENSSSTEKTFERPSGYTSMSTESGEDSLVNVYVAGVFDAEHAIRVGIEKSDSHRVGYQIVPKIELRSTSRELVNVVLNWLRSIGVHARMENRGTNRSSYLIQIEKRDDVERVIEAIRPYLIVQDRTADVVLEEIIGRLNEDRVITEERFVEMVGYADSLPEISPGNKKYTAAYFREEFGLEEPEEEPEA